MVDSATGWIEISAVPSARVNLVFNQVELAWFTHNPPPNNVTVDRENKFLAEFRGMIIKDYGITIGPITTRNPKANSILERVHQTIRNILYTVLC